MRVIVIGSGIAGAATAYQLTRRGAEVTVLDSGEPGTATSAGAGIIAPWASRYLAGEEYRLAAAAAAYYSDLVEQLAEDGQRDTSYAVVGGLIVATDEDECAAAYQRARDRAAEDAAAGTVRLLDSGEVTELFPVLSTDLAAVHVSGAGRVDGRALRAALLRAAADRGALLLEETAELDMRRDRVAGVLAGGARLAADAVVIAAGAWAPRLLAPLGVRLAVSAQRGQISHLRLPGSDTAGWPVVLPVSSHYMLAFPDSRVVVGATRETGTGFDHRVTAAGQHEVLTQALGIAPGLGDAELVETRVGFRPLSADGAPLLGAPDGFPEVIVACGYGPSGLTIGPYAGELAAALALGERPAFDVGPFRPDRPTLTT